MMNIIKLVIVFINRCEVGKVDCWKCIIVVVWELIKEMGDLGFFMCVFVDKV